MQPYKRRRRTRRDMVTLGGWLFADLLLGLSMLFLVANTRGAPPPEPTPTPLPNYEATADAEIAANNASASSTQAALEDQITGLESDRTAADATRSAEATNQAMTADQRATADAEATDQAVVARATIEALSTEQARSQTDQQALNNELATNVAEATMVAEQVSAQSTEQAQLQAQATENARTGVNAEGTTVALENRLATTEAERDAAQSQSANANTDVERAVATRDAAVAQSANANATVESAQATTDAAQNEAAQAQQQAQLNSVNADGVAQTINVDIDGVLAGDETALNNARAELNRVLQPYVDAQICRIGFVLISSGAPDIGRGVDLSERIGQMIQEEYPQLLPEPTEGQPSELAYESIALIGSTPNGEVQLLLFMSTGCPVEG